MALESFEYTKTWESADDFPTIETDEIKVREDIQCLYDEIAAGLNRLITALNAGGIDTAQIADGAVTTGKIDDGAVTLAKLAADVKTVFWAVYGTTTKDELDAAYAAGKEILCVYDRCVYRMSQKNAAGLYYFEMADPTQMRHRQLTFNSSNLAWNNSNYTFLPKNNAAMTGTPTAPTAPAGTNSTQVATTAFVKTAVDSAKTVFWVTYGSTPTTYIDTAYNAGKLIATIISNQDGDTIYTLVNREEVQPNAYKYTFAAVSKDEHGITYYNTVTNQNNTWATGAALQLSGITYDDLPDKPKINNVTLTGNKTPTDLGLVEDPGGNRGEMLYYDLAHSWMSGSPDSLGLINVLNAEHGVTPIADTEAAYQAGKAIFCAGEVDGETVIIPLVHRRSSTWFDFAGVIPWLLYDTSCTNQGWQSIGSSYLPRLQYSGTPAAPGTADRGTSTQAARADHVHPLPWTPPVADGTYVLKCVKSGSTITYSWEAQT